MRIRLGVMCAVLCLVPAFMLMPARADLASGDLSIAAVVNDEAISNADVEGRMRLALLGAGMQPPPEVVARLKNQILRAMVDERLQLQEANRLGVTVEDAELAQELAHLAQQNGVPPDQLAGFFASRGVPISALREQIKASIAWAKVVQRKIRPQVVVGEDEVDAEVARLQATAGAQEFLVASILLPVDKPQDEDNIRQTGLRLIEQMARGARFSAVARQFSQDSTAASGGDLGWVRPGQLDPQVDAALAQMKPGTVSPPLRVANGFQIVMLREVRQGLAGAASPASPAPAPAPAPTPTSSPATPGTVTLRQVLLPHATAQDVQTLQKLRAQAQSCADMERLAHAQGDKTGGNLGTVPLDKLPAAMKPLLAALPVGVPSVPLKNENGILFVMVCDRQAPTPATAPVPAAVPPAPAGNAPAIDRDKVLNVLGTQKLELQARRYLRDLRQEAFIEIRQ